MIWLSPTNNLEERVEVKVKSIISNTWRKILLKNDLTNREEDPIAKVDNLKDTFIARELYRLTCQKLVEQKKEGEAKDSLALQQNLSRTHQEID